MRPEPSLMRLPAGGQTATTALLLFSAASPPHQRSPVAPRLCAPLTTDAYGHAALHVDLEGMRSVRRLSSMPVCPEGSTRIVFVSDTHAQLGEIALPDGDILVHTGDVTFCARGGLHASPSPGAVSSHARCIHARHPTACPIFSDRLLVPIGLSDRRVFRSGRGGHLLPNWQITGRRRGL